MQNNNNNNNNNNLRESYNTLCVGKLFIEWEREL